MVAPEFHWKIAFKLFDMNGDGTVSKDEFDKIMNHAASELAVGHRMGSVSSSPFLTDSEQIE